MKNEPLTAQDTRYVRAPLCTKPNNALELLESDEDTVGQKIHYISLVAA